MTQPGWHAEPGNPALERYWDGTQWTPQTRDARSKIAFAADAVSTTEPDRLGAPEASIRQTRGAAPAVPVAKTCAVGPCNNSRLDGYVFCEKHASGTAFRPGAAPRDRTAQIVCPHCQSRGSVTTKRVKQKKGVSGGKLTGAVLTGGISMLGTGLSRKEKGTEMHCHNCNTKWVV